MYWIKKKIVSSILKKKVVYVHATFIVMIIEFFKALAMLCGRF